MNGFLRSCLIALAFTISLAAVVLFILIRYGSAIEQYFHKTADKKSKADLEAILPEPPTKRLIGDDLQISSPLHQHVYTQNKLKIAGKARAAYVMVTLNKGDDRVVTTGEGDHFEATVDLAPGLNQVTFLMVTSQGKLLKKELTVGYYPSLQNPSHYRSILGEVKHIDEKNQQFTIVSDKDSYEIALAPNLFINYFDTAGKKIRLYFKNLENSERIAVLASQPSSGPYVAEEALVDRYPYTVSGVLHKVESNRLILHQDRIEGAEYQVITTPAPAIKQWRGGDNLAQIQLNDLKIGDFISAVAYVIPKENRTLYYPYRLLQVQGLKVDQ